MNRVNEGRACARVAVALAVLTFTACPATIDTGDGGDGPISAGPSGGLFIRNGYGINIPAGALTTDTVITVTIIDTGIPDVPTRKRISFGYRFSPTSLTFKTPVTVYLPWVADRVPDAVDSSTFDMRRQAGSEAYAQLPGTKTDTTPFQAVEAQADRLGLFWVTSPSDPNIDRIEIDPPAATLMVGGTQAFTAKVIAPTGETVNASVTWGMVPPRVGSIDANGVFTAKAPGTATITARAGNQAATAKVYVPGTTPSASTFVHQNPFPTGNDLFGGAFAPLALGTVVAGANGTVLARTATGTWSRLFSTPGVTFTAVGGTTQENAVAIGHQATAGVLVEFKGSLAPVFKVFSPTDISDLVALWFDGTSGMGVGSGNSVVIRRDGAWTTEYHPSFEKLLSVIGDGAGGFVVVGELGSIYKWDPVRTVWDSLYDTRLSVKLDAAVLLNFATADAWAVGGNKLWHFVGTGWASESLPATPSLETATSIGLIDGHIVVGGQVPVSTTPAPEAKGVVLVRSATPDADAGVTLTSWAPFSLRNLQVPRGIFGQGANGYVVGDLGAVWRWNSASVAFVEESQGFYGDIADLAVLDDDVFAAVNECKTVACTARVGHVMHSNAGNWSELGALPSPEVILAVAAKSPSEVVASTPSGVFRWDGTSWGVLPINAASGALLDLQYCGASLWGVGENAAVYRGTGTQLSNVGSVNGSGSARAIQCPSENEIWVAGDGFLTSRTGNANWAAKTSMMVNQQPWFSVWSPGGGEGFAFGNSRYGIYYDTVNLSVIQSLGAIVPDVTTGLYGATIDTLYAVGLSKYPVAFGFAARFDGVNWTLVDSGAQRKSTAIHGTSSSNMWIGTEGGGVLKAAAPK